MLQESLFALRQCTRCGETKATTNFSRHRGMADGYNLHCKQCIADYQKAWYGKNRQQVIDRSKAWRQSNRERFQANANRRRNERKEVVRQQQREWSKRNPEVGRKGAQTRRQRMKMLELLEISKRDFVRLYASPCSSCGSTKDICLDHIIPIARGGRHSIGNAQPLCRRCNASKGTKLMIEWRHFLMKQTP